MHFSDKDLIDYVGEENLKISRLITTEEKMILQKFCDEMSVEFGVATAITDPDGTPVLEYSNFTELCGSHIRGCEEGLKRCKQEAHIKGEMAKKMGKPLVYRCHAGITDFIAPIILLNRRIGNIAGGQFLTKKPDAEMYEHFRCYFDEIGVKDKEKALQSLSSQYINSSHRIAKLASIYLSIGKLLSKYFYFQVEYGMNIRRRLTAEKELRRSNFKLTALNKEIQSSQEKLQHQYEELKTTQTALGESEEQYRSLINNISIGVYRSTSDPEGYFLQANPAIAKIFGYDSVEEFMGISFIDLYQNPDDRRCFVEDIRRDGFVKNREISFHRKDGKPIWCSITTTVQYDENGNIKWMDGVIEDITERKQVEEVLRSAHEQLEIKVEERTQELKAANQELIAMNDEHIAMNQQLTAMNTELIHTNEKLEKEIAERQRIEQELADANKKITQSFEELKTMQTHLIQSEKMAALGNLVAGVAHEINTPIGVGITASSYLNQVTEQFLELCKNGAPHRQDLVNYLETLQESSSIILKNLERAGKLIQSFKQVSADQSSEVQRVFNVKKYLEEILLSMHPRIKKTKHHIKVECADDLEINGFPGAFAQVVSNLMMNSLTHAYGPDDEGNIRIAAQKEDGYLIFTFSDDGKGMETNVLARIFDPFFTTKRGTGGTGLGLYIVYNIITQRFGGTIDCDSAPGKGTSFEIRLPIRKDD